MSLDVNDRLGRSRTLRRLWRAMGRPRAWVTGGAVRDRLLGLPTADVDLVVEGTLESARGPALALAEALGGHALPLGRAPRAVWRIEGGRLKAEIWPLGELTPREDALRRDVTINAILWELPAGPVLDPTGGLDDLSRRRLRAVSRVNLEDDPVRLLRTPRLAAQLPGFAVERRTAGWLRELAPLLRRAPQERVGRELQRLLDAPDPARGWRLLVRTGLLGAAAPRGAALRTGAARAAAALERLASPRSHPLPGAARRHGGAARLGLLLRAWGTPPDRDIAPYAWTRDRRAAALTAARLAEAAIQAATADWVARRRLVHRAGGSTPAVLVLAAALEPLDGSSWRRFWRLWRRRGPELAEPSPLLNGTEIRRLTGVGPGPELGALLRALVDAQVDARVRTEAQARRFLHRLAHDPPVPARS